MGRYGEAAIDYETSALNGHMNFWLWILSYVDKERIANSPTVSHRV